MKLSPTAKRTAAYVLVAAAVAFAIAVGSVSGVALGPASDPSGVRITAFLSATTVAQNQTIRVIVTEQNDLPVTNVLPLSEDWRVQNLSMGPCWSDAVFPFGIALYQGRYGIDNISSARPLEIYAPGVYSCPDLKGGDSITFAPLQAVTDFVDLRGYWTEGFTASPGGFFEGVLHPFLPGEYTLVAGDEWGHLQILHFQVMGIALEDFSLCPSNCGYPAPYLSGFIYFGGPSPLKSLQLFVNGTDEGTGTYDTGLANFVMWYKGGFQHPEVVSGDAYVLRFVAVFEDNSMAMATTTVKAG